MQYIAEQMPNNDNLWVPVETETGLPYLECVAVCNSRNGGRKFWKSCVACIYRETGEDDRAYDPDCLDCRKTRGHGRLRLNEDDRD